MEAFIVAGQLDRVKLCCRHMLKRFGTETRKVAIFASENLENPTAIIQVRDGALAKKPSACSTLRMSVVTSGIAVSAYDDSWYDRSEWADNIVRGAVRLAANIFSDGSESELTNELYEEAKKFFTCKYIVNEEKCLQCGKTCDWGEAKKAPCQRECVSGALSWTGDHIRLDVAKCTNCGRCVSACLHSVISCNEQAE